MKRVVVLGGGLSGLAAAHRLRELDPSLEVEVLEASSRAGGILGTIEREGFVIETGPDSILRDKPAAISLATRLGLEPRLIRTRPERGGAYVVCRGRLERVPEGFGLLAPGRVLPWARTPIMSSFGKARALLEPLLPTHPIADEESLAAFVRRRLGAEVLDRLAQPLVGGIYGGDAEALSLEATMPRFIEMERRHGSVVRGLYAAARSAPAPSGARYSLFVAFDRGMQVLVDALEGRLPPLRFDARVEALETRDTGVKVRLEGGSSLDADAAVLALPAPVASRVIGGADPALGQMLGAIRYGSAATVTLAYRRSDVPHPLDAYGFVVPRVERRAILAATFSSEKWPGRAPEDQVLIRVFIGGDRADDARSLDDAGLIAAARRELGALLGVQAAPSLTLVGRYLDAMPQYRVGHLRLVGRIEARLAHHPRLTLAGNAYRGVGIPDAIAAAEGAAEALLGR